MDDRLERLRNVGPNVAAHLRHVGVSTVSDLRGADADELYERACARAGTRLDPCLLDTFASAVDQANGKPARDWWEYSRERLAAAGG